MKTVQSRVRATPETQKSRKDGVSQENDPTCRNSHCTMWSVSSPDSIIPVCCSSQQEIEVVKERRVSFPDILMSWGGGTPQSTVLKMVQPQDNHQLLASQTELEHEKSLYKSPAETQNYPVVADEPVAIDDMQDIFSSKNSKTFVKILKLPVALYDLLSYARGDDELEELDGFFRHCLPCRDEPPDDQENGNKTNLQADTTEVIPCQIPMNSSQIKNKMNESVWSVESLAPFIPSKEWILQNAVFEPDMIIEMIEESNNCRYSTQNDLIVKAGKIRQNYRFSSSDSVPVSDSSLIFSTPAEKPPKKAGMQSEMSAAKKDHSMTPSEKLLLASPTCLQSKIISPSLTAEGVDENKSSEPEAYQSPNQEYLIVNEQRERSPCSHEQGATLLLSSAAVEETSSRDQLIEQNLVDIVVEDGTYGSEEQSRLRNEKLCLPVAEQNAEVSKTQCQQCSSKGPLVDCGVQCTELKDLQELCMGDMEPKRGHPSKYSEVKKSKKGKDEVFSMNTQKNQRRHNQWRNGGSERYSSQQDTVNGYSSRPGKSKGGNVRNPRY
ncbi:Hypothetical protein SMAX5B_001096 [Scophthalmus maximus]|uniref:Uncharacterized protein n=1 Tax=Scophthalmus maximus TaxID=52904 RepID=A0A2U9CTM1_SCOMX|nr:Hypothetical protein SMAX5B_001096 [Scophthalmus maximus]